ncbi:MAG: hypothetical protein U0T36_09265 [Saprospiraceae bacterium]
MSAKTIQNTSIQTLIWCMMMITVGCTQSPPEEEVVAAPTIYDGCCGTEPKQLTIGSLNVYIPNIITPNGDGINDVFIPQSNSMTNATFYVVNFYIYDTLDNVIIYARGLNVEDTKNWGFTGIASKTPFNPSTQSNYKYTGKFKYSFTVGNRFPDGNGIDVEVKGEGCVVRCDEDAHVIKTKNGCYFPIQGVNGVYDGTIPNQEENCIK